MRRLARITVSRELLVAALHWPAEAAVLRACETLNGDLDLVVEHRWLKPVAGGQEIPRTDPLYFAGPRCRQEQVWFVSWGQCHDELSERSEIT